MNLPATISSVQVPVLSHKNVVASEASNSRLVFFKELYLVWSNTRDLVLSLFQAFMILKSKSESQTDTIVEPYVIHDKVS